MRIKIYTDFAIFGSGSWGTALSCQLARRHEKVTLYTTSKEIVSSIKYNEINNKHLKDIRLPQNIIPTDDIQELQNKEVIIIAVPSYALPKAVDSLKEVSISKKTILLIASKGLVDNPSQLFSDLLQNIFPENISAFIAGPNFASEVALGLYSQSTIACTDLSVAKNLADSISSENFVIDTTDDIITIQIAGIIKNIIAIKSGMNEANGGRENAKAALITSALAEIAMLANVLGGRRESLISPGVLGDLVLTSYSKTSRNMKFGYEYAKAVDKKVFLQNYPNLVEGKESINALMNLIKRYNLELPVINSVYEQLTDIL